MMKKPLSGEATTYGEYFSRGTPSLHCIGILGGIIWMIGLSFSILASGAAGYAISYGLGQGSTLIASLWGFYLERILKSTRRNKQPAICYVSSLSYRTHFDSCFKILLAYE